jgi:SpoIVB peptidase S55
MTHSIRFLHRSFIARAVLISFLLLQACHASAGPKAETYWQVDEIRTGMKGTGRTVIKGTKIENFNAEVLGILRNTSPGRDIILCRLSGLDLEKTGVIAGMSGSPVYINGKLLGAVAYAWPYGKEPIAGVTPFVQMQDYVASYEKRDLAQKEKVQRIGLARPLAIEGRSYDTVAVSQDFSDAPHSSLQEAEQGILSMMPLRTPLVTSGMTPNSLALLREPIGKFGMVPMQGGTISGNVSEEDRSAPLLPGSAMCVPMVMGDFDMSSIGTVTHVEGKRVYGFGHPFMSLGSCDFPLMTGYVHLIFPRQTVSFKMGSPVKVVGVINADVSTCVAGWLDQKPDMLPVNMTVLRDGGSKTFHVQMVKQRAIMGMLFQAVLNNSIDMEGDLPEEMTANLKVRIEVDGREPVTLNDVFSGTAVAGNRAPQALYTQVVMLLNQMNFNNFEDLRINKIECVTEILPGRRTADIDSVEMETDTYAPGETVKAIVVLRTYKGTRQRVPVSLTLPADLPEGSYTATVSDDVASARQELRDNPLVNFPQNTDQLFKGLQIITGVKRTTLTVRLPLTGSGVAVGGKALPNLPPSMVQMLSNSRHSGAQSLGSAVVTRQPTEWVIQGAESLRFTVAKNTKVTR